MCVSTSSNPATLTLLIKSSVRCVGYDWRPSRCSDANADAKPQTEMFWRQADKYKRPADDLLPNKMDKPARNLYARFDDQVPSWRDPVVSSCGSGRNEFKRRRQI